MPMNPQSGRVAQEEIAWSLEPDNHLKYKQLLTSKSHGPDISVTLVEIDGKHLELRTDSSSRVYVIYEGEFTFTIEGSTFSAKKGDVLRIARGETYSFQGAGRYLVINSPAFKSGDDIYSDGKTDR
jgi:mannose-6-phosphate isomerase-like protein (cupin superfamily)